MAVEAGPRPDRKYYRDDDPLPDEPAADSDGENEARATLADRRAATPSPDLFRDPLHGERTDEERQEPSKAIPGGTYVAPEYAPQKGSVLDRINPFAKKSE